MTTADPTPDQTALTRIAALRSAHDRLQAVVEPLTPEQIRGRGYPSEWTIAQVLSHIGSGAEINALILDAGLSGSEPPVQADFVAIWDRWNAKGPDEQAADALKYNRVLVEKIEALDADQRATATFTIWSGPVSLSDFAGSRLSEAAVHLWDVEVVVDPTATVTPEAVGIIADGVSRLIGFAAKPGPAGRIHVTTTDPDREFALTLGEKVALEPWDGGESTGTLAIPAEAFMRLAYGRLDPDHTPPVTATGIDLDTLRAVFPGF
jgi:uncharacterized protein (TIGR03083 family)